MKKILMLTTACFGLGAEAVAQTNLNTDTAYDEIIVRAQKRDQSIKDVPAAITALGQDELTALGVQQFDDLADFIPGLEVQEQSANNPGFVIRGLTSDNGDPAIEPRVSIFQDGVPNSRARGSFVEVFDTEVEVLRGPQPTLFGRSALIGAISLNSIRPETGGDYNGYARIGYGSYDFKFVEGAVNIPLTDTLAARVAGRFKEREGYITSVTDQDDFQGFQMGAIRGSLLWEPSDALSGLLIVNYQKDDNPGTSFKSGTFRPFGGSTDPFQAAALNFFGGEFSEGKTELGLERTLWNVTGRIDYAINDRISLTSITGYREFDSDEIFDPDGFQYDLFLFAEDAEGEQISQEFRVNFNEGGKFAGFAGVSYFAEEGEQRVPLRYDQNVAGALLTANPATGLPLLFTAPPGIEQDPTPLSVIESVVGIPAELAIFEEVFSNLSDNKSYEAFADFTVKVTDRLDVTGGLRYTYDEKETGRIAFTQGGQGSLLTGAGVFLGSTVLLNDGSGFRTEDDVVSVSDDFSGWTGRFAVNYDLTDDVVVFANYGRGRLPEVLGFEDDPAIIGLDESEFITIDAETVNSFEVGTKGTFFDGILQADGSFYYYDYSNFQTSILRGVGDVIPVNAGGATAYGFEGSAVLQVSEVVSLFGNYAFNDATFDDESDDGEPQQFAGNRFRLAPEHAVTVGIDASVETEYGTFGLRPIYTYRSEVFFDNDNDRPDLQGADQIVDEVQEGFGVLDLRATWTSLDGSYQVEIFGENILDEEYLLDAGNTGDTFGIPTFIAAPPATYGVYLSRQF